MKEDEPEQRTHKMTKRENPHRIHRSWDAKRRLRKNYRKYIDVLAIHAETTASPHNIKKIYQTARKMSRRFKATNQ